ARRIAAGIASSVNAGWIPTTRSARRSNYQPSGGVILAASGNRTIGSSARDSDRWQRPGEERRRMKVIANAFGERPMLKLMYAALVRATAQWRGITVTFERRQCGGV